MDENMIASDLVEYLNDCNKVKGKVHSVFEHTINIMTSDGFLIGIYSSEKAIAPMSFIWKAIVQSNIKKDVPLVLHMGCIQFVGLDLVIHTGAFSIWDCGPILMSKKSEMGTYERRLNQVKEVLFGQGNSDGILDIAYYLSWSENGCKPVLNLYSAFIYERVQAFLEGISTGNAESACYWVKKIIGFGPGLTPSTDDFLSGVMSGIYYLGHYYDLDKKFILDFNERLMNVIEGETNVISENMLRWASRGLLADSYRKVYMSLLYDTGISVEEAVEEAIGFGETSGSDFLLGVYMVNKLFLDQNTREAYNDCQTPNQEEYIL